VESHPRRHGDHRTTGRQRDRARPAAAYLDLQRLQPRREGCDTSPAASTDGVPAGADPDIGDIGYYAPSGDLVFYYGDVGYWNGIVRLGRFDTTMELIEHQDDNFRVRIERG
jgi:hypothetical protein